MHRRSISAPQLRQVTCKSGPGKEYGANLPVNMLYRLHKPVIATRGTLESLLSQAC